MLILALVCAILAVVVLRVRRPAEVPNSSRLYRIDSRVVASVLAVLAITFLILAYTSGKLLF
ncbi:MAG: hypothetical protein ABSD56_04690 [Bryobacteraceae bacterium]